MYGIVNKSLQELVIEKLSEDKWSSIQEKNCAEHDFFISNEYYNDAITLRLVTAIAKEMNLSISEMMTTFGEWWILKTVKEKYSGFLESCGENLREFIINLPSFHNRIELIYPKASMPEFKVSDQTYNSINLHYLSNRKGFQEFMIGILQGLSIVFNETIHLEMIQSRENGFSHEIFKITWI